MAEQADEHKRGGLTQLAATAICGNDITSSCLYVSALAIIAAGKWAPISLLMVAAVLYLFRSIYAEVVGALPLNGGAYNALLNTTSKFRASIAACLTILSYMATAVISASVAIYYVNNLWDLPETAVTIGLLAFFMVLTIIGITESARVAVVIFFIHLGSLTLLLVVGGVYLSGTGLDQLWANFQEPTEGGVPKALFFGFCAAMLGVSGFESSSNFVEEQAEGVFPKTLRNMWLAVSIFNPLMVLLVLAIIPMQDVALHKKAILADIGLKTAGNWLLWLISINAALVLSGAVLASFVGVNGLIRRMTLDRCLPQFLLKTNQRGTTHRIIIGFFLLAVSVLLISRGDNQLETLGVVYTLSFLSVMALFGIGNVLLKVRRAKLPRPSHAPWLSVLIGIIAVGAGIVGNAIVNREHLLVFLYYFIPTMLIIIIMLTRIRILKSCLFTVRVASVSVHKLMGGIAEKLRHKINQVNEQQIVFFTRGDNVANLNNAILYVQRNEHTNRVKIVTVVKDAKAVPEKLSQDIAFLDEAYPNIDIDFVVLEGDFGPQMIQDLAQQWNIPVNLMFIGSPAGKLIYGLADLGGVRMII